MIEVNHLSKLYGANRAVDDISFSIAPGEIIGFLGPNGAGKSTTMNMITGYISSTTGSIKIDGIDILEKPAEAKKRIGYLPEIPPLYLDMTLDEYLAFVYELKGVALPRKKHLEQIKELTQLSHMGGRLLRNFSKGYRQRAGLAQALVGDPPVLILDEPTIGLDPKQIIEFRKLISSLGKMTIFSTHILSEASAICSRMLIINHGKLIVQGTREQIAGISKFDYTITVAGDAAKVSEILHKVEDVKKASCLWEKDSTASFSLKCERDVRIDLFRALKEADMPILLLEETTMTLEEIFMKAVSEKGGEAI